VRHNIEMGGGGEGSYAQNIQKIKNNNMCPKTFCLGL